MALLDDLLARMRATSGLSDVQIVENEAVDDETFVFKVRAAMIPNVLQIRFLTDKNLERYSFQLYGDRPLLRWDNAPHYPGLPNFPHHFHDQDEKISFSTLTGSLLNDFDLVIAEVKKYTNL
jgi:hypothetical protein